MHRRGVQCFPELASRSASSLRSIQTAEASSSRRHASFIPTRKPPPHSPDISLSALEALPKQLAATAVKKERKKGWRHDKAYAGETHRLTAVVKSTQNTARVPSIEKSKFFSEPQDDAWNLDLQQLEFRGKQRMLPGTLVEIRRNGVCSHGIVLFDIPVMGRWTVHSLQPSGEMWSHAEEDVMFAISSFIDQDLAERCGRVLLAETEGQIASRVRVLKRLRNFEMELERVYNTIVPSISDAYYKERASNADDWAQVSTAQVAKAVNSKTKDIDAMTMLAVHKFLFSRYKYFVAEPTNFLEKQTFWVRPWQHIQDMNAVDQMLAHQDSQLDAFFTKARAIIAASRERSLATWKDAPSMTPDNHFQFSEGDMTIIRFFRASLRTKRSIQQDPYIILQSRIMKRLNVYTGEVDDSMVHKFLMELGVLSPWEDLITRAELHERLGRPILMATMPSHAASIAPPPPDAIGADKTYSRDIVESIRHDFGTMPVYVIDDFGAEELDDGVSIEEIPSEPGNSWLHVHIADPTAVLPPSHPYSRQARTKLESYYFLDRSEPMLPATDLITRLSLNSGSSSDAPQNVLTFSAKVNEQGDIVDYKVRPGLVRNVTLLKYDVVDVELGFEQRFARYPFGAPSEPPSVNSTFISPAIREDLRAIHRVTRNVLAQRVRAGAFTYALDNVEMELKTKPLPTAPPNPARPLAFKGFPELVYKIRSFQDVESGARGLVAECMKTASRVASRFFADRGIPGIRRVVERPHSEVEGGYEALMATRDAEGFVDVYATMRLGLASAPARYVLTPEEHGALGIPAGEGYMRVTSPLRRFSDMVAHWQIKYALLHPEAPARMFSEEWLEVYAKDVSFREVGLKRAQAMQHEYWALQYLQRCMEERERTGGGYAMLDGLEARVSTLSVANIRKHCLQYSVFLPGLGLRATLGKVDSTALMHNIGDSVPVKLDTVRLGLKPQLTVVRR